VNLLIHAYGAAHAAEARRVWGYGTLVRVRHAMTMTPSRGKPYRLERGQVGKIERASVTYSDHYIVTFGRRRVLLDHDLLEAW